VELKKIADGFSYSKSISQTKKLLTVNCTNDIEDLFKKMFELDPDDRITFSDIRRHPVFAKHFPIVAEASKILYGKKFQPSKIIKKSFINKLPNKKIEEDEDNIRTTMSVIRKRDK
jgi:serine/threonine protein kinase